MKKTAALIIALLSLPSFAGEKECSLFYNNFNKLKKNMTVETHTKFEMYRDNSFYSECIKEKVKLTYNEYTSNLNLYTVLPTNKNIYLNFNNYNGEQFSQDYINSILFENKKLKAKEISLLFKKNTKVFRKNNVIPESLYINKANHIKIDCNNNKVPWDIKLDAPKFRLKSLTIKNCKISSVDDLYKIYSSKIILENITANKIIIPNRFEHSNRIKILKLKKKKK